MALIPMYSIVFGYYLLISNSDWLKDLSGNHDDNEPIKNDDSNDAERVKQYLNGRLGWGMFFIGGYAIVRGISI